MYLLEETEEARYMRQNVITLLQSKDIENFYLAMDLIQGGGMHESFLQVSVEKSIQEELLSIFFERVFYYLDFEKLSKMHKFPYLEFLSIDIEIREYLFTPSNVELCVPLLREIFSKTKIKHIFFKNHQKNEDMSRYLEKLRGFNEYIAFTVITHEGFCIALQRK